MTPQRTPGAKVVVVGPGIVGMPMAALLADATRRLDQPPGEVVVVQRNSPTSGWKVDAINRGESPIGGVEPELERLIADNVAAGTLRASHSYDEVQDAAAIIVSVQTDKHGLAPDYRPLTEALHGIAGALAAATNRTRPLVIIESTLAPSSMQTVVRPLFESHGLREGIDISLGNSPNRVMPGRLVERLRNSVKIVGALRPQTAKNISALYRRIVTHGELRETDSLTAEVVKTLENAYRDVRIAFVADLARWCDTHDIDFFSLRERVNDQLARSDGASYDGTAVPSGALLIPTVGVGGHCLPKDGVLLWWRALEGGVPSEGSVILAARRINCESPQETMRLALRAGARLTGERVAVLGAAYRPDSADTRNSPSLQLALLLRDAGSKVIVHDPYVRAEDANLAQLDLTSCFTNCLSLALRDAEIIFMGAGHAVFSDLPSTLATRAPRARILVDGTNSFRPSEFVGKTVRYTGIGRGRREPTNDLVANVVAQFALIERAVANEVADLCEFFNERYSPADMPAVAFENVRSLARTCPTACDIVEAGELPYALPATGFVSRLAAHAIARVSLVPRGTEAPVGLNGDRRRGSAERSHRTDSAKQGSTLSGS